MNEQEHQTLGKLLEFLKKEQKDSNDLSVYLVKIENEIRALREHNEEIHKSLTDLQIKLLDPVEGVIVTVNKNSEWREEYKNQFEDLQALLRWKSTIDKLMWIIIIALVGLGINAIFL